MRVAVELEKLRWCVAVQMTQVSNPTGTVRET